MTDAPPRIAVVGSSGAGKTTLGRQLAARYGVPFVELDALHWAPGWTEVPTEELRRRVTDAVSAPGWVVDGNYPTARDLVWARATHVVWLDLPLRVVVWRLVLRSLRRGWSGEELWHGNREQLATNFASRDSVIWYAITIFRKRRAAYERLLADPASPPITRLRSPREVDAWLAL